MKHKIVHEETIIDGFKYCLINEAYFQASVDFFFEVFLKDEPTSQSFGGYNYRHPLILKQVENVISDGVSLMALDTTQNDKLVGIRLAYTVTRDQVEPKQSFEAYCQDFPATHAGILCLFDELMHSSDIFRQRPDVTKIYDMFALATLPNYRGKGLATQLVQQALLVAKKAQCNGVTVLASSDYTRRIFNKLGMEVIGSKDWTDLKNPADGKSIFSDVPSEKATAHFKKL